MGIYDRDYYRREGPSYIGTFSRAGNVVKWLVVINAVVFIIQLVNAGRGGDVGGFTKALWMEPEAVFQQGQIWRLLTGAFLHSPTSFGHIFWNMIALWFFGPDMESRYGSKEFLSFYLVAGILGNLFWGLTALAQPAAEIGNQAILTVALGASGAVVAVVVLCAFHFPYRTVLLFFVIPVPLWLLATFLVALDMFHFFGNQQTTVAVAAHLGGAGFAYIYYKTQLNLLSIWGGIRKSFRRTRQPKLRMYREPPEHDPVSPRARPSRAVDEQLEARMDAILRKVSQSGMDSLTNEERDILQRASEQFKKR